MKTMPSTVVALLAVAALAGCAERPSSAEPLFAEDHRAGSPGGSTTQVTLVFDDASVVRFYAQPGPQDAFAATSSVPRWILEAAAHAGADASFSSLTHLGGDRDALARLEDAMMAPREDTPRPTVGGCGADFPSWRYTRFLPDNTTDTFRVETYCPGDPAISDPRTKDATAAHEVFLAFVATAKK